MPSPREVDGDNIREHELLQEVPDRVVQLVEQMMKEKLNKLHRPGKDANFFIVLFVQV